MWVEGRAGVAQAEDPARAVRRRHLERGIEGAKKRKMTYTAVTVFCIIIFGVALVPIAAEISEFGALVSSEAFVSLIGAIVAAVLAMVCAYLSERERRRIRELEGERGGVIIGIEIGGSKSER